MKYVAALLCCLLASVSAAPTCSAVLDGAGLDVNFPGQVAHAIHSMTVDDLKRFEPSVTEMNRVPTVNFDLSSSQAILPYAIEVKKTETDMFLTEGMNTLNGVLMHMNEKHWDVSGFNVLERVAHSFHMREVWARILAEYRRIKAQPPTDDVCKCVMDVDNNGVMKMLRFTAMAIREPDLVYGSPKFSSRNAVEKDQVYGNVYTYHFYKKVNAKASLQDLVLQNHGDSMPSLKSVEAWKVWRGEPIQMQDKQGAPVHNSEYYQPAMFLFCALKPSN